MFKRGVYMCVCVCVKKREMEDGIWVCDYGWTREGAITWAGGTKSWCQLSKF